MSRKARWGIKDLSLPSPATEADLRQGLTLLLAEPARLALQEGLELSYVVGLYRGVLDANVLLGKALLRYNTLVDSRFQNARAAHLFAQAEVLRDSMQMFSLNGSTPMLRFGYFREDDRSVDSVLNKDTEIYRATTQRLKVEMKGPNKYNTSLRDVILFTWRFSMLSQINNFAISEERINTAYVDMTTDVENRDVYRKFLKLGVNALQHADELMGRADG